MTIDDDLRSRLSATRAPIDVDASLQALHQARGRRNTLRGLVAASAIVVLVAGLFAAVRLGSDEATTVDVADRTPPTEPGPTTPTDPSGSLPGDTPSIIVDRTIGIVSVDRDGVIRINGVEHEPDLPADRGPLRVIDANGAAGSLLVATDGGVFLDGIVWHKAPDARLLDVVGPELRNLIAWTIPEGNSPSGPVVGIDEWGPDGRRDRPIIATEDFGGVVTNGSFGWTRNELVLLTVDDGRDCNRQVVIDLDGILVEDAPLNRRSACFAGEIAGWSEAGHTVLARPTEQDTWILTVIAKSGRVVESRVPGAFQPRHVDVHSTANGRTEALVLGTGEETVYLDVDAYLAAENPDSVIGGFVNEPPASRIHLVSGIAQHDISAPVERPSDPGTPPPPGTPQDVFEVTRVPADDVLNVRAGPGMEHPIRFTLAPDATGVVAVGEPVAAPEGGTWVEIYNPVSGLDEEDDSGWVNTAFLRPHEVPDRRPCMFNGPQDHYIGIDWSSVDIGGPESSAGVVSALDTYRFGGCIRTVVQFGTELAPTGEAPPATGLPTDIVVTRGRPISVDLGAAVVGAVPDASDSRAVGLDAGHFSAFVTIDDDRGLSMELYMPSDLVDVAFDAHASRIVIDVAEGPPDDPRGEGPRRPLFDGDGLVITGGGENGADFTIAGLARPFEATMGLSLAIDGEPVEARFRGTFADPGEQVAATALMTTGWAEGWGRFEFVVSLDENEVDGLVIGFEATGGGVEDPPTVDVPLETLRASPAWRAS